MALFDGAVTAVISEAVEAWRKAWIATPGKMVVHLSAHRGPGAPTVESLRTACGNCLLLHEPGQTIPLGGAMIGLKLSARTARTGDISLITQLASAARRNLLQTVCLQLGIKTAVQAAAHRETSTQSSTNPALCFAISGSFGRACSIIVSPAAAAAARKKLASHTIPVRPLSRSLDALAKHPTRVSARVGSCTIDQVEFKSLVPGDVLVLDQRISDDLGLIVDGLDVDRSKLAVRRNGSDLVLYQAQKDSPA